MSDQPKSANIIIGGGAVGCAVAYSSIIDHSTPR